MQLRRPQLSILLFALALCFLPLLFAYLRPSLLLLLSSLLLALLFLLFLGAAFYPPVGIAFLASWVPSAACSVSLGLG